MSDITEIKNIELNFQTSDANNSGEVVSTKYYEIIRPAEITINFVYE
jgi:hypothetical protein